MLKIREIKEWHNFKPKYTFSQLQLFLPQRFESQTIQDSRLYKALNKLTKKAFPTEKSHCEKRWSDFYIPFKRRDYFILVPITIILYDKRFFLSFQHSQVEVCKGNNKNDFFLGLINQTLEFSRIIKKNPDIVIESVPYDIRTGRVLGKYVLENLLPAEKKAKILKLYNDHLKREEKLHCISLNDYLNTAALCYKASFGNKTNSLSAEQMYKKWSDGRDCGMLEIKNKKSSKDFNYWLNNKSHCGGHPFEIVYSWHGHGIHLFPPYQNKPYFTLTVTNYNYAMSFLEMIKTLIRNRTPFKAHELEIVLSYLSGESYFTVNVYDKHCIFYCAENRKLFKYIEWDKPNLLKWK